MGFNIRVFIDIAHLVGFFYKRLDTNIILKVKIAEQTNHHYVLRQKHWDVQFRIVACGCYQNIRKAAGEKNELCLKNKVF